MALPLPSSLSPSKVSSFTDCALAFRFSTIERLPEAPSSAASKGTLVHRALERLFWHVPPAARTESAGLAQLDMAWAELASHREFTGLELDAQAEAELLQDAATLVRNYFALEDPTTVRAIGMELRLEARLGTLRLRGIIDRLELDADGELVVTDFKTGKAPGETYESRRLGGVQFYAWLCEQALGRRPARVQLLHLREPLAIVSIPTAQSLRGMEGRTSAIWAAVERACADEDFRPRPSKLCDHCSFKAYCPAFGGDPAMAAAGVSAGTPPLVPA
ncbi:MAG: PD-(D/E)XK nuclease family protein [Actinomycetota bacterium]|nr:PD-(D/E)XK nuclease family protein [Actinomycetota bacterium]PLS75940.1 MAG: PD-(D/E)XK nuclease family protein [Actinomycetota bacterium]